MLGRNGIPMRVVRVEDPSTEPAIPNATESESDEHLYSLDDLGKAYADAIQGLESESLQDALQSLQAQTETSSHHGKAMDAVAPVPIEQLAAPESVESDGVPVSTASIVEAILFRGSTSNTPIPPTAFNGLIRGMTDQELASIVEQLNQTYREDGHAMTIVRQESGYRMTLDAVLEQTKERFYGKAREAQLNQQAIDCLALIAYQPGVTREQIETQWSQPAGAVLSSLVKKGLICTRPLEASNETAKDAGASANKKSRELGYFTTERFLEIAGIESLADLPQADEL